MGSRELCGRGCGKQEAGGRVSPPPFPWDWESVAGSWGRIRPPALCSQLSLPITGSTQTRLHPKGLVLPSGLEFRLLSPPPLLSSCCGLLASKHPRRLSMSSPCSARAQPRCPSPWDHDKELLGAQRVREDVVGPGAASLVLLCWEGSGLWASPLSLALAGPWQELLTACSLAVVSTPPCSALAFGVSLALPGLSVPEATAPPSPSPHADQVLGEAGFPVHSLSGVEGRQPRWLAGDRLWARLVLGGL